MHVQNQEKWSVETEVLVVGSGAAGLTAAIVAHDGGAKVILLEKSSQFGGATAVSGGGLWVPNNRFLRAGYKIDVWDPKKKAWVKESDSKEKALRYMKRSSLGMSTDELMETYVNTINEACNYLEENTRLKFSHARLLPEYYPEWGPDGAAQSGRSIEPQLYDMKKMPPEIAEKIRITPTSMPLLIDEIDSWGGLATFSTRWDLELIGKRMVDRIMGGGVALVAALVHSCHDRGIDMRLDTSARHLVVEGGRVIGVFAEHEGKELRIHAKKGVILCAGGFEWNESMVSCFLRGPMVGPLSPPHNTGDGHRMGAEVGAQLTLMYDAWWFPSTHVPGDEYDGKPYYKTLLYEKGLPGTMIVNKYGNRFTNEAANYRGLLRVWHTWDPVKYEYTNIPAWLILDQACHERYTILLVPPMGELPEPPFKRGDTLKELAEKANIDPDGLEEMVKRFNKYAKEGRDPEFHRGESWYDKFYGDSNWKPNPSLGPIEKPPFYAIEVLPGCLGTCGGLKINKRAQVIDHDNRPISGLYAAGNNTGTIMGMGYPGGGATLGPAVCFGYIAGKEVVKE